MSLKEKRVTKYNIKKIGLSINLVFLTSYFHVLPISHYISQFLIQQINATNFY